MPEKSKIIDPLPPIDHTQIQYDKFEKNFYQEHEEIKLMSNEQANDLRKTLGIKVSGLNPAKPVCSFAHFNFDEQLLRVIRKSEYTQPTPIQAQVIKTHLNLKIFILIYSKKAIPVAMSGRDIIGIAKTGSGKTAAFLWPALVHIMDQKELEPGDGPIAIILAPTRELAQQVNFLLKILIILMFKIVLFKKIRIHNSNFQIRYISVFFLIAFIIYFLMNSLLGCYRNLI